MEVMDESILLDERHLAVCPFTGPMALNPGPLIVRV